MCKIYEVITLDIGYTPIVILTNLNPLLLRLGITTYFQVSKKKKCAHDQFESSCLDFEQTTAWTRNEEHVRCDPH